MTSKNDVISQSSLILTPDDHRIVDLKYEAGDKFTIHDLNDTFCTDLFALFKGQQSIIEIQGYALSHESVILYDAKVIEPNVPEANFHWLLSDQDLEESFYYLGSTFEEARGILIDA